MNFLKLYLSMFLILCSGITLHSQEKKEFKPIKVEIGDEPAVVLEGVKVSLGDAIKQAIENNFDILSGAYDVAMADSLYQSLQTKYSVFLGLEHGGKYAKYPDAMSIFSGEEEKTYNITASVGKYFSSGTTIAAGLKHEYTDSKLNPAISMISSDITSTSYKPAIFFSIKQELLKNVIGMNDRKLDKILKNVSKIQKNAILEILSLVVVGVIYDYWTVVLNSTTLKNAILQVKETRKVRNITARNVRLGMADSFQLNYYNAFLASAEASEVRAKQVYRDSVRKFLTTINFDENSEIQGTAYFTNKLPEIDFNSALKIAYKKRADYKNALLALQNANMNLKIHKNEALPSLTAELSTSFIAQQEKASDAYKNMGSAKYPIIEGKIMLTYPLDDRAQKVNERNSRYKLKQAKINLNKIKRNVKDDITNKVENIGTLYNLYKKAKEARMQADIAYKKMLANLRRGRLNYSIVKDGLDALIQSRQGELGALVYYNLSLLQLDVAKNELFEKYDIDVDKYIPK